MVDGEVRDSRLLGWLGEMYGVPSDVARSLLGWVSGTSAHSVANVARVRERLADAGWIRVVTPGGPGSRGWLVPTRRGCPEWRPWVPSPWTMQHVRADAVARLWLEARFPEIRLYVPRRRLERDAAQSGSRVRGRVPDGVAVFPSGDAAVEVERSRKARGELEAAVADLCGRFPRVFYLCDRGVQGYVADAVARLEHVGRIPVRVVDVRAAPTLEDVETVLAERFPAPRQPITVAAGE